MKLTDLWLKDVLGGLPKESRVATDEELRGLYGDDYTTFTRYGLELVKVMRRGELDPEVDFVFSRRMPVKDGKIVDLTSIHIECASDATDGEHQIEVYAMCGAYEADANELWLTDMVPTHSLMSISTTLTDGEFKVGMSSTEGVGDKDSVFAQRKVSSDRKTEICHLLLWE